MDDERELQEVTVLVERITALAADAARLRALLRELVEAPYAGYRYSDVPSNGWDECAYCSAERWPVDVEFPHDDDCPVARARAEVGDDE